MPTPSPVRHGTALLVLSQEDLLVLTPSIRVVHKYPSIGSLGRRDRASMAAEGFAFVLLCVCIVCVFTQQKLERKTHLLETFCKLEICKCWPFLYSACHFSHC